MDGKERDAFYIGAALFVNLDSAEVDSILADAGLSTENDSVAVCRSAIRVRFPLLYEVGLVAEPF